jgi:hypothetical protein
VSRESLALRAYARAASAAKAVLPRPVREPIERRIGEHIERRRAIDLSATRVLRDAPQEQLTDRAALERLLVEAGLNDEIPEQLPPELRAVAGRGLRLWQYPVQFAPYLMALAPSGIRRYLEIGVRYGGSFVTTVEYLARFNELEEAVAVDIDPLTALLPYVLEQPAVRVLQADTQTTAFEAWVHRAGPFDLAFVDGLHSEEACRRDFESVKDHARMIAMHDIVSPLVPDVGTVWRAVREEYADRFEFHEFVDQYPNLDLSTGPHMGVGLAVRRDPVR